MQAKTLTRACFTAPNIGNPAFRMALGRLLVRGAPDTNVSLPPLATLVPRGVTNWQKVSKAAFAARRREGLKS